ncbi:hypothetical protein M404DRAFT_1004443 [Pisolithus tinctorius Marx 270]|uniref:Uncharacterized protein n=1 Tax=Pisolithus tinctorius Marx 270 TaxID=870435 RepID=A0A0C3NWZ6_PISTI|nr:hypothetical protein M404DRAFT_1004443 [Pisolithus tinctorius Marx 270]
MSSSDASLRLAVASDPLPSTLLQKTPFRFANVEHKEVHITQYPRSRSIELLDIHVVNSRPSRRQQLPFFRETHVKEGLSGNLRLTV